MNSYIYNHYVKKVQKESQQSSPCSANTKHKALLANTRDISLHVSAQNSLELGAEASDPPKADEGQKQSGVKSDNEQQDGQDGRSPDGTEVPALMVKDIS